MLSTDGTISDGRSGLFAGFLYVLLATPTEGGAIVIESLITRSSSSIVSISPPGGLPPRRDGSGIGSVCIWTLCRIFIGLLFDECGLSPSHSIEADERYPIPPAVGSDDGRGIDDAGYARWEEPDAADGLLSRSLFCNLGDDEDECELDEVSPSEGRLKKACCNA